LLLATLRTAITDAANCSLPSSVATPQGRKK
jgi:hypothetical protein